MRCAQQAVIAGFGRTAYSRSSGRRTSTLALTACRDALDDAGMAASEVEGVVSFSTGDPTSSNEVGYLLGLDGLRGRLAPGFEGLRPNVFTLVTSDEAKAVRIPTRIAGLTPAGARIGLPVKAEITPLAGGDYRIAVFRAEPG